MVFIYETLMFFILLGTFLLVLKGLFNEAKSKPKNEKEEKHDT